MKRAKNEIEVGAPVTGADPTGRRYRQRGRVVRMERDALGILEVFVQWAGDITPTLHHRHELRHTHTRPDLAQIGFGAIWDRPEDLDETEHVLLDLLHEARVKIPTGDPILLDLIERDLVCVVGVPGILTRVHLTPKGRVTARLLETP